MTESTTTDPRDLVEAADDLTEPTDALAAIGELRRWLELQEEEAVLKARVEGRPWGYIAERLGRSKQAVWEKHHDRWLPTSRWALLEWPSNETTND
jgi:hypothetical protein